VSFFSGVAEGGGRVKGARIWNAIFAVQLSELQDMQTESLRSIWRSNAS
jgi:hypothetical protein